VLGVISTSLPAALRTFLLTLAVVDDLLAITVIAIFYTSALHLVPLLLALLPIGLFAVLVRRGLRAGWALLRPALAAWGLVHASGVHATVAGVLLAFTVPVRPGLAERFEHRMRPLSAGFAVPVFAFFAAGVSVTEGFGASPVFLGVVLGLVVDKIIRITAAAWLVRRFTHARLAEGLSWWDVLGLAMLGGVGFTVSPLIGELAFGAGSVRNEEAKLGILVGSLIAALGATVVLRIRDRIYRRICAEESADADGDGTPDVYQRDAP
jgi:NhaA family Na+:H+ antiporter